MSFELFVICQRLFTEEVLPPVTTQNMGNQESKILATKDNAQGVKISGPKESTLNITSTTNARSANKSFVIPNMNSLRSLIAKASDFQLFNAQTNVSLFKRALIPLGSNFVKFAINNFNSYSINFESWSNLFGLFAAWRKVGVIANNRKIIAFFLKYFNSFTISSVSFFKSLLFLDACNGFHLFLQSCYLAVTHKNLPVVFIYNLLYNIIRSLLNVFNAKGEYVNLDFTLSVNSRRYVNAGVHSIGIDIVFRSGVVEIARTIPFIMINSKDLSLRDLTKYFPVSTSFLQRLVRSVNFRSVFFNVTKYNFESGSAIYATPSSGASSPIFVTRNINSLMSENVAVTLNSFNQLILLFLIGRCPTTIINNDNYTNMWVMHFVNEFITDPSIDFFNSNLHFEFSFKSGSVVVGAYDALPVTAINMSNQCDIIGIDLKSSSVIVESILFCLNSIEGHDIDRMFSPVNTSMYMYYNTIVNGNFNINMAAVDGVKDNISEVSVSDFVVMSLICRYMGSFFPSIINVLTFEESFIPADKGVVSGEMYDTSISWSVFVDSIFPTFISMNIYPLTNIVEIDNYPSLLSMVAVVGYSEYTVTRGKTFTIPGAGINKSNLVATDSDVNFNAIDSQKNSNVQ